MRFFTTTALIVGMGLAPALRAQNPASLPEAPSTSRQQSQPKPQPVKAPEPQKPAQTAPTPVPATPAPEAKPVPATPAAQPAAAQAKAEPAPAPAATAVSSNDEPSITLTKRVDVVNVIFTVADKRGRFVKDLTEKDFIVRDNKQPPKQIVGFNRETNLPLRVGLLIDASNSIRDRFKFEQESASEFLSQVIRPKSDLAFVIGFDSTAEITADYTDDSEKLTKGIHALRPGGGTAIYDAVFRACRDKLMKAPQSGPVRRAIVVISDGADNQSRSTRDEAIEMAQRAEVIIYAISTNNSSDMGREGDKVLKRMAEETGGRAFFPFKAEDVANAFSAIQDELRSQYAIAYKPAEMAADGAYHTIEISSETRKNLKVRARKGYYAPKP